MPQAAAFTVQDREGTPANHTFTPAGQGKDGAWIFAETAATKVGERRIHIGIRKSAENYKVRLLLVDPVVGTEVINGVSNPKVLRTSYADVTFTYSDKSDLQSRKNLIGMFANSLASSQAVIDGVITKLEALY